MAQRTAATAGKRVLASKGSWQARGGKQVLTNCVCITAKHVQIGKYICIRVPYSVYACAHCPPQHIPTSSLGTSTGTTTAWSGTVCEEARTLSVPPCTWTSLYVYPTCRQAVRAMKHNIPHMEALCLVARHTRPGVKVWTTTNGSAAQNVPFPLQL